MKAKDLKNSILQMAVEGKLVPQDPNDEPASVLLERIREEKQKLIAEGKVKFPKGGESIIYIGSDGSPYEKRIDAKGRVLSEKCIADEIPFEELPERWVWARLETALVNRDSERIPVSVADRERLAKIYDYYGASGVIDKVDRYLFDKTLLLIGEDGANLLMRSKPIAFLARGKYWVNNHAHVLDGINERYLEYIALFINSISLAPYVTGTAQPKMNQTKMGSILIPIPPESEQTRILAKVNELMPLVEEYGKLEDAREALDAALPDRLRKSVLQIAVQGKLVPQDPADEPASTLLDRIRGQRRQLVAEKKVKAPKGGESVIFRGSDGRRYEKSIDAKGRESEPVCIEDEIPFDVPDSWEWARLETVATYIQRGKSPKYSSIEEYPVVAQKCNQWSGFSLEKAKFIDPDTVCKYGNERILQDGDLLWNSTGLGTLGRMAIYDSSKNKYSWAVADSHVTVIRTRENWFDYRFAFAYFAGPSVQSVIEEQASGSTKQKELTQETVKNYLIPIPSLAEQRRIVAQLEAVLPRITKQ